MKRVLIRMAALLLALGWGSSVALAAAPEVSVEQWHATLTAFVTATGVRQAYTQGELRALDYLKGAFQSMGYSQENGTLEEQWMSAPMPILRKLGWVQGMTNLIAVKRAKSENPSIIVVSAHYDTMYGTPGAKDNGSGVAALMTLARLFYSLEPFSDTELRFVAFAAEEKGEFGSGFYVAELTEAEKERVLAVFNIDLITVDAGAENVALCCNTLGGRTAEGYREGAPERPAHNSASLAFLQALRELGGGAAEEEGDSWCIPRHWGDSDHTRFADGGMDAANICFQGNVAAEGAWPGDMHTPDDVLKPYDLPRTQQALDALCRAVYGLAADHGYGR